MALTPANVLGKVIEARVGKAKLTRATTLLTLLNAGRAFTTSDTELNWTVDVGGETAAWEAMTADGANTAEGTTVPASLSTGTHRLKHQFTMSKIEIGKALARAAQGGYQGNDVDGIHMSPLADLFGSQMDRAVNSLMQKLNTTLWVGNGTATHGNVIGFQSIIDGASYAGISGVTYPEWTAVKQDTADDDVIDRDDFRALETLIKTRETTYDTIITTPALGELYSKAYDIDAAELAVANLREGTGLFARADLGFGNRFYNGVPINEDTQATANKFTLMNSGDVDLWFMRLPNGTEDQQGNTGIGQHYVTDAYGFPIHIAELPSNNSAVRRFELFVLPQLRVFARRSLMQLTVTTA
jgi:hypothetical protein